MILTIPAGLAAASRETPARAQWLDRLPEFLQDVAAKWALVSVGAPFEAGCAWVAPVKTAAGDEAILKLPMPHMEARDEIAGLRFWNGDATVRLLEADEGLGAMLLERCRPGTSLRQLPEAEQDVVIAALLRSLWRPAPAGVFRPLSGMIDFWSGEVRGSSGLVQEGLRLYAELSRAPCDEALLATDLHAGNVLRAERAPWLTIDPKPFVGDRAWDLTQHLWNCAARLRRDPAGTIRRMADLCEVDAERVRLWMFARAATGPPGWSDLAIRLA